MSNINCSSKIVYGVNVDFSFSHISNKQYLPLALKTAPLGLLGAQWLRLHPPQRGLKCSIPGQGDKIPRASRQKPKNIKQK